MFGLGTQELLIILTLVMVVFGAGKLPEVGSSLGRGIRNFKQGMNENDGLQLDVDSVQKVSSEDK